MYMKIFYKTTNTRQNLMIKNGLNQQKWSWKVLDLDLSLLTHTSYSTDFASSYFHLFHSQQNDMKTEMIFIRLSGENVFGNL